MGFTCQHLVELARSRTCASLHDKGKIRELVGRYGRPHASLVYGSHNPATERLQVRTDFCVVYWRITLVCQWQLGFVRYLAARWPRCSAFNLTSSRIEITKLKIPNSSRFDIPSVLYITWANTALFCNDPWSDEVGELVPYCIYVLLAKHQ